MSELSLRGERVALRLLREDDRPRLRQILAEPAVAAWWGSASPDDAADDLFEPYQTAFAIEVDDALVGSIQYVEESTPSYRHAGIDVFVETDHQRQGIGGDAIRTLARYLFDVRGHNRLTIDPASANERAVGAYRRVGFKPVGTMRAYERGQDGVWHDGLLMDMLEGELT